MKKRCFIFLLLAVSFMLMFPLAAHADVLIEPNNDFYTRHSGECVSLNRSFYVNGESGFVSFKKQPGSNDETARLENGDVINIMFTYSHNSEAWGVAEIYNTEDEPNGWVPMNQLLLKYDYISFAEDYQSEFYSYTGGYDMLYEARDIVLWTWPGSGETAWILENQWRNSEADANFFMASHAYMDEEGREWGFFGYIYGSKNSWICLSDPTNTDISAFNPATPPELWQPDNTTAPSNGLPAPVLAIILVAVLVIGTVILIRVFWKPSRNQNV